MDETTTTAEKPAPTPVKAAATAPPARPWYGRMWLVVPLLVFLYPVGLAALWAGSRRSTGAKVGLTLCFGVFFLVMLAGNPKRHRGGDSTQTSPAEADASARSIDNISDRTDAELADWIAVYRRDRDDLAAKLLAEEARHPRFQVDGEVRDRDETRLVVFGLAVPMNPSDQNHLGSVMRKASIVVENYDQRRLMGGQYYACQHNYLRKETGKNGFGGSVPVWVYGAAPEVQKARGRLAKADEKLTKAEAEQTRRAQAKVAQAAPTSAPAGVR